MLELEFKLRESISKALSSMTNESVPLFEISPPKDEKHGDFTTNAAMIVASKLKMAPRKIAEELVGKIEFPEGIEKAEIAGPGFINFRLNISWFQNHLKTIEKLGEKYGSSNLGKSKKVQVEFVSANPTGPLHIGHGRGAVYGDTIANILSAIGYDVTREYYINDYGVQMKTLGLSVLSRMKELQGEKIEFSEDCYQGDYIKDIAKEMLAENKSILNLPEDEAIAKCTDYAGNKILEEIKIDLKKLGISHDVYFSESTLHKKGEVKVAINKLKEKGYLYEDDGALWFKSTEFGDDKDRVLIKKDGTYTYLTADVAYHYDKFERGFERVIDIWGADHGGYVSRMKATIEALGNDPKKFDAVLIQLVNLVRGGKKVSMSTRRATYETLEDVREKVGKDVCRYFFLMRSHTAPLDFDLELAEKHTPENPVFYIQYAHARIASVFRKADEMGSSESNKNLDKLNLPEELSLMRQIANYPKVVLDAAESLEPHRIAYYLLDLSRNFQSYYSRARDDDKYKFLTENKEITGAKLYLLKNIKQVLFNGLKLLGISAPNEMTRGE